MRELLGDSEYGLIVENDDESFYLGMKSMLIEKSKLSSYAEKACERGRSFSASALTLDAEILFEKMAGR